MIFRASSITIYHVTSYDQFHCFFYKICVIWLYLVILMDRKQSEACNCCNVALIQIPVLAVGQFWSQGRTVKRPDEYKLPAVVEVYAFIDRIVQ